MRVGRVRPAPDRPPERDRGPDRAAYLALACATGVGPRTCGALVRAFGSPSRAVRAPASRLAHVPGIGSARAHAIARALAEADPAAMDADAARAGLALVPPADDGYPRARVDAPDPPAALWIRGAFPGDGPQAESGGGVAGAARDEGPVAAAAAPGRPRPRLAVAVVGTRGASAYGLRVARD